MDAPVGGLLAERPDLAEGDVLGRPAGQPGARLLRDELRQRRIGEGALSCVQVRFGGWMHCEWLNDENFSRSLPGEYRSEEPVARMSARNCAEILAAE